MMCGRRVRTRSIVVVLTLCAGVDAALGAEQSGCSALKGGSGCREGPEQQGEFTDDDNDDVSLLQLKRVRNIVGVQGGPREEAQHLLSRPAAPIAFATKDDAVVPAASVAADSPTAAPQAFYSVHTGYIPAGGSILVEVMTIERAKQTCAAMSLCKGFSYEGGPVGDSSRDAPLRVYFKNKWGSIAGTGWTSYHRYETTNLLQPARRSSDGVSTAPADARNLSTVDARRSSDGVSTAPADARNLSTADAWAAEADRLVDRIGDGVNRIGQHTRAAFLAIASMVQHGSTTIASKVQRGLGKLRQSSNTTSIAVSRASNDVLENGSHIEYMLLIVLCVPLLAGLAAVIAITVAGWTRSPGAPPPKSSSLFATDSTTSGPVSEGPASST